MKKLLTGLAVIIFLGYIFIQNGGRIFLIALSQHRLANPFQFIAGTSASGATPPTYKEGTYTGSVTDAFYGNVQVQVVIQNGKISDVQFLQHPSDALRSVAINDIAMPNLKQEAIQTQSASVNVVTGATDTSNAFMQSLQSALNQAKS
jgi:uncharacterized protein with FMN-binding domain